MPTDKKCRFYILYNLNQEYIFKIRLLNCDKHKRFKQLELFLICFILNHVRLGKILRMRRNLNEQLLNARYNLVEYIFCEMRHI